MTLKIKRIPSLVAVLTLSYNAYADMPMVDPATYPPMLDGLTAPYVKTNYFPLPTANTDGTGQARIFVDFASVGNNDPLVKPMQQGMSHSHTCWGNPLPCLYSAADLNLRNQSDLSPERKVYIGMQATSPIPQTQSKGGSLNFSAYWAPSIVDTSNNSWVPVSGNLVYYKSGMPATSVQPVNRPPVGLRMVTGDATRTIPYQNSGWGDNMAAVRFTCHYPVTNTYGERDKSYIPSCAKGGAIKMFIIFPQCVKTDPALVDMSIDAESGLAKNPLGMMLDSANHKSHLSYINQTLGCPAGTARIPHISFNWSAPVTKPEGTVNWRLSSDNYPHVPGVQDAGYSLHADYVFGWRLDTIQTMIDSCINNGLDCIANLIAADKILYKP